MREVFEQLSTKEHGLVRVAMWVITCSFFLAWVSGFDWNPENITAGNSQSSGMRQTMDSCSLFIAISVAQIREPWIYFVIGQSRRMAPAYTSIWLRIFKLRYRLKSLRWTWRRAYNFSVSARQLSLTIHTQYSG